MNHDPFDAPDAGSDEAAPVPSGRPAASERVGVPAVDAVLEEIESVGDLPVADQVVVFERAHDQLRRALDAADASDGPGR